MKKNKNKKLKKYNKSGFSTLEGYTWSDTLGCYYNSTYGYKDEYGKKLNDSYFTGEYE